MKQEYHSNATTNVAIRTLIKNSSSSNRELMMRFNLSEPTVIKWKDRTENTDRSSRPHNIHYSLDELHRQIIIAVRRATWMPLDEVWEVAEQLDSKATRSAVYRSLRSEGISKVPEKEREKAKKFKEYEPGYLHIDVTYLPKIDGIKYYLFVAIDRATRILFYRVYDAKTAENAEDFMGKCIGFFPFGITHVLTDNGLEFTNKLIKSKKDQYCTKPSKLDVICGENDIEHRLTKVNTPKTNGMVERVNGTIKNGTILKQQYGSATEMKADMMRFLLFYILYRRHGSLKRELGVKTPFQAVETWYELKPEIFIQTPEKFKRKLLHLKSTFKASLTKQPCET